MKKIFLAITTACIALAGNAQVTASFGVEAGTTSTYIRSINFPGNEDSEYDMGGGVYVGAVVHINKGKRFGINTGLRYSSSKSFENTKVLNLPGLTVKGNVTMSFVEIPVNFVFTSPKCKKWAAAFGPVLKYAVAGHRDYKFYGYPFPPLDEDIKFGNGAQETKPLQTAFSAGLTRSLGKKMNLSVAYQFGVNDIDNSHDYETKFNSLRLGLQYNF